eukprot:Clim_evm21s239 gene=Clim_evmTU21s239
MAARVRKILSDLVPEFGESAKLQSVMYEVKGRVAHITLNRPERLNAIDMRMPKEIKHCVAKANADERVNCIVLTGAGRSFCAGYDLIDYAEKKGTNEGSQDMPWDPQIDYEFMYANTQDFMSLWRSYKPTIAKVKGHAIAGGSDIALSCDLVVMTDEAKIGYPPARVWGVPTTAMWVYRVGLEQAKRMLFQGEVIDGKEAKRIGLVMDAVPAADIDSYVDRLTARISSVPKNQLAMTKQIVNHAADQMGIQSTQQFATWFDGIARHSPEGMAFKKRSEQVGFQKAVKERDSGKPFEEMWGPETWENDKKPRF